eukprot:SAG11_NODE_170_length_13624_cov_40.078226_7_plen_149_part_00
MNESPPPLPLDQAAASRSLLEQERAFVAQVVAAAPPPPLDATLSTKRQGSAATARVEWKRRPRTRGGGRGGGACSARLGSARLGAENSASARLGAENSGDGGTWAAAFALAKERLETRHKKVARVTQPHPLRERTNQRTAYDNIDSFR